MAEKCAVKENRITGRSVFTSIAFIGVALIFPSFASATVTYSINQTNNTTTEQKAAHARIKTAMDSAVHFYTTYTTITKKITVTYEPSVQTADGNSNGSIRFGSNKTYQVALTAMHEIAHTVGIGTTTIWANLTNNNKVYTGTRGTKMLREIDGQSAVLKGDDMHFWPYGLNYASEVKSVDDLINHCRIVNEIYYDMYPDREPPETPVAFMPSLPRNYRTVVFQDAGVTMHLPENGAITATIFTLDGKAADYFTFDNTARNNHLRLSDRNSLPRGTYLYRIISGDLCRKGTFTVMR